MVAGLREIWELQQTDSRISELRKKIAALDTGEEAGNARRSAQQLHDEAAARLHKIDTELSDTELTIKSTESKRQDFENRMYSGKVTNPKELEAMGQEIQMLVKNRDRLETRELELLDEQAEARAQVAQAKADLEAKESELNRVLSETRQEKDRLHAELQEAEEARTAAETAASQASKTLLKRYENLRQKLGNIAVAQAIGSSCGVCHIQITPSVMKDLRETDEVSTCESCGRILYYAP